LNIASLIISPSFPEGQVLEASTFTAFAQLVDSILTSFLWYYVGAFFTISINPKNPKWSFFPALDYPSRACFFYPIT